MGGWGWVGGGVAAVVVVVVAVVVVAVVAVGVLVVVTGDQQGVNGRSWGAQEQHSRSNWPAR